MNAFSKGLVIFSPVDGVVTDKGVAIEGAEVSRRAIWKDERFEQTTKTDNKGRFSFEALTQTSLFWAFFPHNPSIMQRLDVATNGNSKEAWAFTKGNYELNGENNGKSLFMQCELSNEEASRDIDSLRSYWGFCTLK